MTKSKLKAAISRSGRLKATRTDTFGANTDQGNASYFGQMVLGTHSVYAINFEAHIKTDYNDKTRRCWRAYNKETGCLVSTIRSTKAYRLALLWASSDPDFLSGKKRTTIKAGLPTIKGKRGEHCRHRCGMEWCCNPGHITIGSRVANEVDKHFHYFLNHCQAEVRETFRVAFKHLCKQERLF